MALSKEERQVIKQAKQEGKSKVQAMQELSSFRNKQENENESFFAETSQDIQQTASNIGERVQDRFDKQTEAFTKQAEGDQTAPETAFQAVGQGFGAAGDVLGEAVLGAGRAVLPQGAEDAVGEAAEGVASAVTSNETVQNLSQRFDRFKQNNPRLARNVDAALGLGQFLAESLGVKGAGTATRSAGRAASEGAQQTTEAAGRATRSVTEPASKAARGASQIAQKGASGAKRFGQNVSRKLDESAERAREIENLPEIQQEAVRANIPDDIRTFVSDADEADLETFREQIDAAEQAEDAVNPTKLPKTVAGERFVDQFKALEERRKEIGQRIGERAAELSKDKNVDVSNALSDIENTLQNLGVSVTRRSDGDAELDFSGTDFTDKQRRVVKDLFEKAREGGEELSPSQILKKDRLLGRIQREADAEEVADLTFTKQDGSTGNLFSEFREVFARELNEIDPEIKELNRQFRPLAATRDQVLQEVLDVRPDRISDEVPLDEFADTAGLQLQRIMGNSKGGRRIERLVERVDEEARKAGFEGASPIQSARFARQLEDFFDITPETSLRGQFESANSTPKGKSEFIDRTIDKGVELTQPTTEEQRRILRDLIEARLNARQQSQGQNQ